MFCFQRSAAVEDEVVQSSSCITMCVFNELDVTELGLGAAFEFSLKVLKFCSDH